MSLVAAPTAEPPAVERLVDDTPPTAPLPAVVPTAAAPAPTPADSLAASVALLLALSVVQRVVGLARGVVFCRWLDPAQLGQWDLAFGFVMFAAPIVVLGLPGSFGRYAEYYRQRGQLRVFLARVCVGTLVTLVAAVAGACVAAPALAELVFGDRALAPFTRLVTLVLAAVILHNTLVSLFSALRLFRVVSLVTFVQSILFAALGCALLALGSRSATTVVVAFGMATAVASLVGAPWLVGVWRQLPVPQQPLAHATFWSKLLPFALWLWITNWLFSLVEVVDRYMIIHYSGLHLEAALDLVGQYHSAKIVPLVLVGVADLVAGVVLPYLSHDWEAGQQLLVSRKLNLALKLLGFGLLLAAVAVLVAAPWLFGLALQNKYVAGQAVLPLILVFCIWSGLTAVAHSYLYCREQVGLSSGTALVGLILNVVLNLLWLPTWGLPGVVWATLVSRGVSMLLMYALSWLHGMKIDPGMIVVSLLPLVLVAGVGPALLVVAWLPLAALASPWLLTTEDKLELKNLMRALLVRLRLAAPAVEPR